MFIQHTIIIQDSRVCVCECVFVCMHICACVYVHMTMCTLQDTIPQALPWLATKTGESAVSFIFFPTIHLTIGLGQWADNASIPNSHVELLL